MYYIIVSIVSIVLFIVNMVLIVDSNLIDKTSFSIKGDTVINKNKIYTFISRRQVVVKNIENHPLVADTTLKQRSCRFHYENEKGLYPLYSYSACNILCRKQAEIEYCQCNNHFMVNTSNFLLIS